MQGSEAVGRYTAMDLTECDREPIHIPESIQPHGILFGLSEDFRITAVSANLANYCGGEPQALLGTKLADLIGTSGPDLGLAAKLEPGQSQHVARFTLPGSDARAWRGFLHAQQDGLLLEAEALSAGADTDALEHFAHFHTAILRLQAAKDFETTCQSLVAETRRLTGYSRVMLYRFAPDWSGEVIAEDNDGCLPGYLGLHFPASDIPTQARALYASNAKRHIPDTAYHPVQVLHARGAPIDLGQVDLRSVSPVHIAYLRNMGVGASMSVSLLRKASLWGLVACHHPYPHSVSAEKMKSCVLLAEVAAARFSLFEEAQVARCDSAVKAVETRLLQQAAEGEDRPGGLLQADLLRNNAEDLLHLLDATGLVLHASGIATTLGDAPSGDTLRSLLGWLAEQAADKLVTDHLAADYPQAAGIPTAAGMLAVKLGGAADDYIIWFRPEVARSRTWAGAPIKLVERRAGLESLTPRHSFAAWMEQVRGRSRAWSTADVVAANNLRDTLMEIVARRATQIQRMNIQLLRNNEELESFAYIASHDLKEPLRQIEMFGTLLQRAFGRQSDPAEKIERWFAGISASSHRLRHLIDHLVQYSRLGSEARAFAPAHIGRIAADALQDFGGQIDACGCTVEIGSLPVVVCDAIQIRQVFQNLIGNAIKYRHPDRTLTLHISAAVEAHADVPMIAVQIADNGIGFEERYCEQIFRPFERLHSAETYEGSGLGLAICRKVIDRHGGTIRANGRIGEGSIFTFILPHRGTCGPEAHSHDTRAESTS